MLRKCQKCQKSGIVSKVKKWGVSVHSRLIRSKKGVKKAFPVSLSNDAQDLDPPRSFPSKKSQATPFQEWACTILIGYKLSTKPRISELEIYCLDTPPICRDCQETRVLTDFWQFDPYLAIWPQSLELGSQSLELGVSKYPPKSTHTDFAVSVHPPICVFLWTALAAHV